MNASGQLVRSVEAPYVANIADWRYIAVEFNADAAQGKIWLASQGPADFDDVALTPMAISHIGNRDAQPDAKGRIGMWDEEEEAIATGKRAGTHRTDPTVKRRALSGLMVESTGDWYAISSVNYGYATDQLDWVLGKNPLNLCMFEGMGKLNPPRYHHR